LSNEWASAVVVDPSALKQLEDEVTRLRAKTAKRRTLSAALLTISVVAVAGLCVQSTRLNARAEETRQYRKTSLHATAALTALAHSHEQILSATEQAPSVGTKSWGRRFTVTKYIPRSPKYGKFNDGRTATLTEADPEARIIAVDPTLIPYGSWVWIEDLGWYHAEDCGGAIKGFRIDILTATEDEAMNFGKQTRFAIVVPGERSLG
jgi:3D (Asp-Asp-Asp) domain-containing protein